MYDYDRLRVACERELEQLCQREFETYARHYVDTLFDTAAKFPGADNFFTTSFLPLPVIGEPHFWAGFEPPELRQLVAAALVARERFRETAPIWAPPLPLREDECEVLRDADDPRLNLVGFYGASSRSVNFDYEAHPRFPAFASGLMAYEHAPLELRNDSRLRAEFPPKRLVGLADGWMVWRSAEQITSDRDMQARYDAEMAAGRQF